MKTEKTVEKMTNKKPSKFRKWLTGITTAVSVSAMTTQAAFAQTGGTGGGTGGTGGGTGTFPIENVTVGTSADAGGMMNKVIGILLTITRYVGVALVVYGVYEIVMSFMQNQPEAKTKGIIMGLAGAAMIALKSILQTVGVVS